MIRKMEKSDLNRCAEILMGAYAEQPYSEVFEQGNARRYLEQKFSYCQDACFVSEVQNIVVGFIIWQVSFWANGKQAILEEIVVDKDFQGRGTGTELEKFSEKLLGEMGVKSLMLWAKKDQQIIGFHHKNGFEIADDYVVMFKNH